MRTLKVTLYGSMCGWLAGFLGGTIILSPLLREATEISGFLFYEYFLAWGVAVVMLPVCGFVVAPLVHQLLTKSWLWSPWLAAAIGGVAGWLALAVWTAGICTLAGRSFLGHDTMTLCLFPASVALTVAVGAATGAGAARAARIF